MYCSLKKKVRGSHTSTLDAFQMRHDEVHSDLCKHNQAIKETEQGFGNGIHHRNRPTDSIVHSGLQSKSNHPDQSIDPTPHVASALCAVQLYTVSRSALVSLLLLETNTMPIACDADVLLSTVLAATLARLPAHDHVFLFRDTMSFMLR